MCFYIENDAQENLLGSIIRVGFVLRVYKGVMSFCIESYVLYRDLRGEIPLETSDLGSKGGMSEA